MLTYQLFLGKNEQARLEFYQQYVDLPREYQTAEAVAKLRRVSTTSIYRMIQVTADELNDLRRERGMEEVPATAAINKKFSFPATAYAVYMMRNSVPGKFVRALINHPEWTVKEFATSLNTSTATVFRRLHPLNEFLRRFDLRINYNPISLSGNETVVRIALSEILWQLSQDGTTVIDADLGDIPAQAAERLEKANLVMPNFAHDRLVLICAVNILRANRKHPLKSIRSLSEVLETTGFQKNLDHMPNFTKDFPNTITLIHLETMLGAGFHNRQDPLLAKFIGFHARKNSADWQLVTLILKRVKAVAGADEHQLDNQVLIGNVLSITVAMNLLGTAVPVFEPVIVKVGTQTPSSLTKALDQIFATLPPHLTGYRRIQTALTNRILPLLATAMPDALEKVHICIDDTMDQQIYAAVETSLSRMPAVRLVTEHSQARLTITADLSKAFSPTTAKSEYFYFPISSYSTWLHLEHYIHYLAVHELGINTGSGINYTPMDYDLATATEN